MKLIFKWLLIIIGILIAVFVIGGFMIPKEWTVSRSITIDAPPEEVYAPIADLRRWQEWSAWTLDSDPTQVYTYDCPEPGVGCKWSWTSENMGTGNLTIVKGDSARGVTYELFLDMSGMQSTMIGEIAFRERDGTTTVTWTDRGNSENNLIKRWMSLMIGKMLGDELDFGLNNLKTLVEKKS